MAIRAPTLDGWVDLSQPLFNGMPGPPAHGVPRFWVDATDVAVTEGRLTARVTPLETAAHIGTHIDTSIHFVPGGRTVAEASGGTASRSRSSSRRSSPPTRRGRPPARPSRCGTGPARRARARA
ncbi:cyclase family protein [Baekduia soli]|uniref:Cyclase family protein n=1 Tax=Baekduia soli TaxID=496014 RepID=A0A5B8U0A4_9ACTN|nr:cyclase family protein [Baekduia soli]